MCCKATLHRLRYRLRKELKSGTSGKSRMTSGGVREKNSINGCMAAASMPVCCRALTAANNSIEQRSADLISRADNQPNSKILRRAQRLQEWAKSLVVSTVFENIIMLLIILNTLGLAVIHYDQPDMMTDVLTVCERVFTGVFLLEAVLKIIGLGSDYFRDTANVFDFFVTVLSCVSLFDFSGGGFSALRSLRAFRGLRVARVLRKFPVVMR